jgi:hypothetical protein
MDADDDEIRTQLLGDIREIFTERGNQIASTDLVQYLSALETRPWGEWKHGKPLSAVQLARLLKPFGISTFNVREGGRVHKAYNRNSFEDAFTRYLKPEDSSATSLQQAKLGQKRTVLPATTDISVAARSATATHDVAAEIGVGALKNRGGSGVAAQMPETGVLEI